MLGERSVVITLVRESQGKYSAIYVLKIGFPWLFYPTVFFTKLRVRRSELSTPLDVS
jgi:hypothetical protein